MEATFAWLDFDCAERERILVTYDRSPGLTAGTFPAVVVRVSWRVVRVQIDYGGGNRKVAHLYSPHDATWLDLDYAAQCRVVSIE